MMKSKFCLLFVFAFLTCLPVFGQNDVVYQRVYIQNVGSIFLPSNMEVQSGAVSELSQNESKRPAQKTKLTVSGDGFVFQPNELSLSNLPYIPALITFSTKYEKGANYPVITAKTAPTKVELQTKCRDSENQLRAMLVRINSKVLNWLDCSNSWIGKRYALKMAYLRQPENAPPIYVEAYVIPNYDRVHTLTISYRQENAILWKPILAAVRDSLIIKTN